MIDEKKLIEDILWKVREQNVISGEVGHNRPFCDKANVIECINNQPKIGEWIPCSERLPEEDGFYMVTLTDKITDIANMRIMKIYFSKISNGFVGYGDTITAWQPLPAPYEVKSDE